MVIDLEIRGLIRLRTPVAEDIFQQILSTIVRPGKPILRTPVAEDIFQQILSTIVRPGKPVVDT